MQYYTQTDKNLNPIMSWGCYYISLVNLAIYITGKIPTPTEVIRAWFRDFEEDDIDVESTIKDPLGVLYEYGITHLTFLGYKDANYPTSDREYEILEFYNKDTGIIHFVLGDGKGQCMFDPYPNSVTVAKGKLRSKRIFRAI